MSVDTVVAVAELVAVPVMETEPLAGTLASTLPSTRPRSTAFTVAPWLAALVWVLDCTRLVVLPPDVVPASVVPASAMRLAALLP